MSQVTSVFTRRQLNIETLSVSPSALEGIHKFTITVFMAKDEIEKVVKQIDKKVDILKAYYNTDDELVHQEIARLLRWAVKVVLLTTVPEPARVQVSAKLNLPPPKAVAPSPSTVLEI